MTTLLLLILSPIVVSTLSARSDSSRDRNAQYQMWKARQDEINRSDYLVDKFDEPRIIKIQPAIYPDSAKTSGLEGEVWVWILVDTTGKPACTRVIKSAGTSFDSAALEAIQQSQFEPRLVNGVKQESAMVLPFRFRMKDNQLESIRQTF